MSNENLSLTYHIHPKVPIKDLIPGTSIRRPRAMQLTKEEVLHCMKYGPVFRVFPGKDPIRVTGDNIDELHRTSYYQETIIPKDDQKEQKEENLDNSTDESEIEQNQEPEEVEEPKSEASEVTDKFADKEIVDSDELVATPNPTFTVDEKVEKETKEEETTTEEATSSTQQEVKPEQPKPVDFIHTNNNYHQNNNYQNYNKNKKKHH